MATGCYVMVCETFLAHDPVVLINVPVTVVGLDLVACAVVLPLRWPKTHPLLVVEEVLVDEVAGWPVAVLRHVDAD